MGIAHPQVSTVIKCQRIFSNGYNRFPKKETIKMVHNQWITPKHTIKPSVVIGQL
jgi:hypothetical protein